MASKKRREPRGQKEDEQVAVVGGGVPMTRYRWRVGGGPTTEEKKRANSSQVRWLRLSINGEVFNSSGIPQYWLLKYKFSIL
jgi:hypothetical protein